MEGQALLEEMEIGCKEQRQIIDEKVCGIYGEGVEYNKEYEYRSKGG